MVLLSVIFIKQDVTFVTFIIFGSDRSPRRGDLVRACVRAGYYSKEH